MSTKVAVVIPAYKDELDPLEKISLAQCRKVLSRYPIIFVAPAGQKFPYIEADDMVAEFPAHNFRSVDTYSQLMLSPQFYETFANFEYILIYQLDAFVFYDALEEFCSLGWDYIGAPWPYIAYFSFHGEKTPRVGNGGFSLRKVAACHKLATQAPHFSWAHMLKDAQEDAVFALCGVSDEIEFNIAPVEVAELFSMEHYPDRHVKRIAGVPFGCHGWTIFSADFYVELFAQFGYDLKPLRGLMDTEDYSFHLPLGLTKVALKRLIRMIEHKRPLLHYLPTKRFASIRVLRSLDAMKILSLLLTEENSLTDKIFVRDAQLDLIRDVTPERLPHLIISADFDAPLIEALEGNGLRYGEHVISFQREYMRRCEEIFHALGK